MKCLQCGAVLKEEDLQCPYCGAVNSEAYKRKTERDTLEEENRLLKEEYLDNSKDELYKKIHQRINFALFCIFIITVFIGYAVFQIGEKQHFGLKGTEKEMVRYYEEGDYANLFLCMKAGDLFDPELRYKYSHMALLWDKYKSCQTYFSLAYQEYEETGFYDCFYLEQCVEYGCEVLTGEFSYDYDELPEENIEAVKPYQEQVMVLFTGMLKIPEELIEEMKQVEYYYERPDALTEYVLEVLPNEY